jgi:hypothetical protein
VLLVLCLVILLRWGHGSSINNPRPVADAASKPGLVESLARALKLREYPSLRLDAGQETALATCINLSRLIDHSVNGVAKFDDPTTGDQLRTWQRKMFPPFYAEFLLAKWHERRGDVDEAKRRMEEALEHAPAVLVRRYQFMDGAPLAQTKVGTLGVECRMKTPTSTDTSRTLEYIDLVTDDKGQVYLPCYDTRIRCNGVQYPKGYEIETGRHGYLDVSARYGLLPTIYVWKKGSPRPPTDLPPSEFYDYRDALQVKERAHRVGDAEFRIDRCFRLTRDGTISATDGLDAVALSEDEPRPSFEDPHVSLDQALVRFNRSATSGHTILQVRLFDHLSRALLTKYHAPAGWSYDGRDEIYVKSFARLLPESVDVWFWVATFSPQDKTQKVLPQVGAEADFRDYSAVLTHVHSGRRSYSTRANSITFKPPAEADESTLQAAFQITPKQTRPKGPHARVAAVNKGGSRLLGDHVIHPSRQVAVFDFPMRLSELDYFEVHPVGQESCFFFDDVRLPGVEDSPLAESWQVVIPTHGQTGSFAAPQAHPAHVKVTVLPGRNSMSFGSRQLSGAAVSHGYWTYGSGDRNVDTHSTIVCEMTGLTARMLRTEIVPLDASGNQLKVGGGAGRAGNITYGAFRVPSHRIHAVRVAFSWSAE